MRRLLANPLLTPLEEQAKRYNVANYGGKNQWCVFSSVNFIQIYNQNRHGEHTYCPGNLYNALINININIVFVF